MHSKSNNSQTCSCGYPLKGMQILILSLILSIVPYAAGPESRGHSRTSFANISMSNCFPNFIVRLILNFVDQPTHKNWYPTNKSDFTVYVFLTFFIGGISLTAGKIVSVLCKSKGKGTNSNKNVKKKYYFRIKLEMCKWSIVYPQALKNENKL